MRMCMNLDHVARSYFVLGRGVLCEFADYWPLAVSMPPTKSYAHSEELLYLEDGRHANPVIMSFDPNKKQSEICERKL